jgi:hypothetical protein
MTNFEILLLVLTGTIAVTGYAIYAAIQRLVACVSSVSDPVATLLLRCGVHDLGKYDFFPYLDAITHCHECILARQQAQDNYEARKRIEEGWRELSVPCPKAGCDGHWKIDFKKNTGEISSVTQTNLCEHAEEMARNPAEFFRPYAEQLR